MFVVVCCWLCLVCVCGCVFVIVFVVVCFVSCVFVIGFVVVFVAVCL